VEIAQEVAPFLFEATKDTFIERLQSTSLTRWKNDNFDVFARVQAGVYESQVIQMTAMSIDKNNVLKVKSIVMALFHYSGQSLRSVQKCNI